MTTRLRKLTPYEKILEGDNATFERLLGIYPVGIVSIVSDTYDLWNVLTVILPRLKPVIMARDGKLVIRPDSGDPSDIICGDGSAKKGSPAWKGAMRLLWETFGGTVNAAGFRELDPHIGMIYGDGISPDRQEDILFRLMAEGYASSNIVMGLGSYTYQYVTRDTDGWAMKATAGTTTSRGDIEIFKDPVTDDGGKRSAAGLLCVVRNDAGKLELEQRVTLEREDQGELTVVFEDGFLTREETLADIRARIENSFTSD